MMRWLWVIGMAAALAVGVWIVWPAVGDSPATQRHAGSLPAPLEAEAPSLSAEGSECFSNLGELAEAVSLYALDHDEQLPAAAHWADQASIYGADAQILHCPSVSRFGYAYVRGLGGTYVASTTDKSNQPLLFDSTNLVANANDDLTSVPRPPRHADRSGKPANLFAYLDGHAGIVRR